MAEQNLNERLLSNKFLADRIRRELKQRQMTNSAFCGMVDSLSDADLISRYLNHHQPPKPKLQTSQVEDGNQDRYNRIIKAAVKRRMETK